MSDIKDGGPAFPCEIGGSDPDANMHQTGANTAMQYGMTLRDFFAAKAMQTILSKVIEVDGSLTVLEVEITTRGAYHIADAMLTARNSS